MKNIYIFKYILEINILIINENKFISFNNSDYNSAL